MLIVITAAMFVYWDNAMSMFSFCLLNEGGIFIPAFAEHRVREVKSMLTSEGTINISHIATLWVFWNHVLG